VGRGCGGRGGEKGGRKVERVRGEREAETRRKWRGGEGKGKRLGTGG